VTNSTVLRRTDPRTLAVRDPPASLVRAVAREADRPASPLLTPLLEALKERFGGALTAVLLYGSCLHDHDVTEGLVDLYAIVDDYDSAYPERSLRWFNRRIPPNVFYLERPGESGTLRSKYAVLSVEHLRRGCTLWYHSYVWARFAQPVRVLYARDERSGDAVHRALSGAVVRFLGEGAAAAERREMPVGELWSSALRRSYAAELRPESEERASYLVERNARAYARFTEHAVPALGGLLEAVGEGRYRPAASDAVRRRVRRRWRVRRWQGRVLSVLRLAKALFTFDDGIDYVAWKVERHTGYAIEVTPRIRRHPLIFVWPELWKLLRSGALR